MEPNALGGVLVYSVSNSEVIEKVHEEGWIHLAIG